MKDCCALAQGAKLVVTVEDHSVIGGLGTCVAETLAPRSPGMPASSSSACRTPSAKAASRRALREARHLGESHRRAHAAALARAAEETPLSMKAWRIDEARRSRGSSASEESHARAGPMEALVRVEAVGTQSSGSLGSKRRAGPQVSAAAHSGLRRHRRDRVLRTGS